MTPRELTPRELSVLPVGPPDPAGSELGRLLDALGAALNGSGPALVPYRAGGPVPQLPEPGAPGPPVVASGIDEAGDEASDPTAVVVATSGSTARPRLVALQASALLASASATHDRLGGAGRWVLALPLEHVAGIQVLVRSLVAGRRPVAVDTRDGFTAAAFADAASAVAHGFSGRCYTALVPTQLIRLLDAGGAALAALGRLDAVLIGGAALAPATRRRAEDAGVAVVTSYGMSETCGGCVYDGRPLDGVGVHLGGQGRISLSGPTIARGYLGETRAAASGFEAGPDGVRRFVTDDTGYLDGDGRLVVTGRLDEAIVTGGLTVSPRAVEAVLAELPGVAEVAVVGVDDARWGQRVVAALVLRPHASAPGLDAVRASVTERLGAGAAPRELHLLDALPLRGPGKPDRSAVLRLVTDRGPAAR